MKFSLLGASTRVLLVTVLVPLSFGCFRGKIKLGLWGEGFRGAVWVTFFIRMMGLHAITVIGLCRHRAQHVAIIVPIVFIPGTLMSSLAIGPALVAA